MAAAMLKELFEQYSTAFAQYVFDGIRNIQNSTINTSNREIGPVTTRRRSPHRDRKIVSFDQSVLDWRS